MQYTNTTTMSYQGTFLSETVTINRTFGEPKKRKDNSFEAKWGVNIKGEKATVETKDGRNFVVYAPTSRAYNGLVNKVQINTI